MRPVWSFGIQEHDSADEFLRQAQSWLLKSEAENNLVLGIATETAAAADDKPSNYLATVESGGRVVGCAYRTSPYKLGLTRMPLKAIPVLADAVGRRFDSLPGVLGPREAARYFSRLWCGPRALGFGTTMNQRIYQVHELKEPNPWPVGSLRPADQTEDRQLIEWLRGFFEETHLPIKNAEDIAHRLLPDHAVFVWVADGVSVSMAGVTGQTPNGVRIGFVFTPPEQRRRGYGSAITAALTRRMLDQGKQFCCLFTDAENPTSNSIYQRLGYVPVADVVDYQFA